MQHRPYRLYLLLAPILAVPLLSQDALAYISPTYLIVKKLAAKHSGSSVVVRSTVTPIAPENTSPRRFKVITEYRAEKGTLSTIVGGGIGQKVQSRETGNDSTSTMTPFSQALDALLYEVRPERLMKALRRAGVPIKTPAEVASTKLKEDKYAIEDTRLSKFNKFVAVVIGVEGRDRGQLWVEKETFLPLRLIVKDGSKISEVRFSKFKPIGKFVFPQSMTFVQNSRETFTEELSEINLLKQNQPSELEKKGNLPGTTPSESDVTKDVVQSYLEIAR